MSSFKIEAWEIEDFHTSAGHSETGPGPAIKPFGFQPLEYSAPRPRRLTEKEAAAEAQEILAAAKVKAQEVEKLAYEQGFLQGKKDGREVGERSLEQAVQRLRNLAAALEEEKTVLFRQREADLLELVLLIGEKLVGHELATQPQRICKIIESGFRHLAETENVRLCVHPHDYEIIQQADLSGWPSGITLAVDGSLTPGGFRLETIHGDIDGALETRWGRVAKVIDDMISNLKGK